MNRFRNQLLASTIIAGVALMAPAMASAQSAPPPPPSDQSQANEVTEVVVTGSRIHRSEYNSPDPIQVISGDTATLEGLANTAQILQTSSLVAGAFQVNNQLTGFVVTGGPGSNTISLRGLGANRTLILVDGHRMGPAGVGGTVGPFDLNVLPASIVDHIEILKDGASSIYGSDAVAGVINVITKKNLDGGVINASVDASQYGGGNLYDVNAAWGKVYDKGFWNVSADYQDQEILTRGQRPDTACAADYDFDPATGKRLDFKQNGHNECYNLFANAFETPDNLGGGPNGFSPRAGGTLILIPQAPGVTYPGASAGNSDNTGGALPAGFAREDRAGYPGTFPYDNFASSLYDQGSIVSPSKLYTLTGRGGFDLTPNTEVYGGFLLNRRDSAQISDRQFFPDVYAGMDNTPASLKTLCTVSNPGCANPFFGPVGPVLLPIVPLKFDFDQRVDYANVDGGIRGKLGDFPIFGGWDWDVHARASRSEGTYGYDFIYNDRVNAIDGLGANNNTTSSVCNQNQITVSSHQKGGQCSTLGPNGLPLLNAAELSGKLTAAEAAFLEGHEQGKTTYDEQEVEASITGDLLTLPAGKLGMAMGVDYRHSSIDDTPGFNELNSNLWGQTSSGITKGSDDVKEAFVEFDVPLVKGAPFMKSLDLRASGRYTDYSLSGSNTTYKVGLDWQVNDWFRLRGTRGTSFRAPALYELFLANQTSFLPQTSVDPCINYQDSGNANLMKNCASVGVPAGYAGNGSSAQITTGGGAGHLKAETSTATTWGFIFTPTFIDFSLAVDYTDIVVTNEVTTFGAGNIASSCYTAVNFPNSPFCSLLTRDENPADTRFLQILTVNSSYVNVANQTERAIDVTARYRHDFDFGRLQIDSQLTWDLENTTQLFAGVAQPSYSGTTFGFKGPAFTGISTVRFEHGPWTALWAIQMIGGGSDRDLIGSQAASTRYSTTCTLGGVVQPCANTNGAGIATAVLINEKNYTEMTTYHTVSLRRTFDTLVIQGGVQNLFNERPPSVSSSEFRVGTAALNGYDMIGRRFFINITKKF
jgi:iron complex outermembrane receptor protein